MSGIIEKVIMCSSYEKPEKHLKYENGKYSEEDGRRPAGYRVMDRDGTYGTPTLIEPVNCIREQVDKWRESGYFGITSITRELLVHWHNMTSPRLFFCQLEAIETIIYISEVSPGILKEMPDFRSDGGKFQRQCVKMATGTGKTAVMGMLIAWQVLNAKRYDSTYSKNILIVSPSLIVLDRLQVLKPSDSGNVYDEFNLVPAHMRDRLNTCNLKITNWHKLMLKEKPAHASHKLSRVGKESVKLFARRLFGGNVSNVLVINDEGHHAWRPEKYNISNRVASEETIAAGIWMKGLDMVHDACGITRCYDFSATPFVSTGRSLTEETLFTWIISDFSLDDAVESGMIKTPHTVHSDNLELEDYRNIYRNDEVRKAFKTGKVHPLVRHAYSALAKNWQEVNRAWKNKNAPTPPVMITVCNETKHAKLVTREMELNTMQLPGELCSKDSILHIDSKTADRIKVGDEHDKDITIRDKAGTVGRPGKPGEKICNIVSVNMLTEGWDTKTVTHIMGLRTFGSQLLCEQVIGRGLRRTSYDVGDDGLFRAEPIIILGVPFGFLPFEETSDEPQPQDPPIEIRVLPERNHHRISWPVVTDVRMFTEYSWQLDKNAKPFRSNDHIPSEIELGVLVDGRSDLLTGKTLTVHRHMQGVEFGVMQAMFLNGLGEAWLKRHDDLTNASPYKDVIGVLDMVGNFLRTKVHTELGEENRTRSLYYQQDTIARHLLNQLSAREQELTKLGISGLGSTSDRKSWYTRSRKTTRTKKTHLNIMTASVDFELEIGKFLDKSLHVLSWIKADMVGFYVNYEDPDKHVTRQYRPDFIVHLDNGVQLILECKGEERGMKAKKEAVKKWVEAVNTDGSYGVWGFGMVFKRDNTNKWKTDLVRMLEVSRAHDMDHSCPGCGRRVETLKDAVRTFGVENRSGFLMARAVCAACRSSS